MFIPKYRRKEIYGQIKSDIGKILRTLCEYKEVEIIEAHAMKDHMLVMIPPKLAVSSFMGYLKDMRIWSTNIAIGIFGPKGILYPR